MSEARDITGQKFGKLTAIKLDHIRHFLYGTKHYWLCKCDCGNYTITNKQYLISGHTTSCGCYIKNKVKKGLRLAHELSKNRIYKIYYGILARCLNPSNKAYPNYGGRGISICKEWNDDFVNFYNWAINNGYKENLTIDRIDVNGNYEPANCQWITLAAQSRNRRKNHLITYKGETHCISEWAKIYNMSPALLLNRLNHKWDFEKAISTSPDIYRKRAEKLIEYNGEFKTKKEWIEILKIHPSTFYRKLKKYRQLSR